MLGSNFQKRLRMERLEQKVPLAADLTVEVINGNLFITGDNGDNRFYFEVDNVDGYQFVLTNYGSINDKVNGQSFETPFYISGVTGDITVNLRGGNDAMFLNGFQSINGEDNFVVPGNLNINMGAGDDLLHLGVTEDLEFFQGPVEVGGNLTVIGGNGNDMTYVSGLLVSNDLIFIDGQGDDQINTVPGWIWPLGVRSTVGGDIVATTGAGADLLALQYFTVEGDVIVTTAAGGDYVILSEFEIGGNVAVGLGAGVNQLDIEFSEIAGGVTVGGTGTNTVLIQFSNIESFLAIATGNNDDFVSLISVVTPSAVIGTFGGHDIVSIDGSSFGLLVVELGAGNDTLTLGGSNGGVNVSVLALLSGGSGSDTYQTYRGVKNRMLIELDLAFERFEVIEPWWI